MTDEDTASVDSFMNYVVKRNPNEPKFTQAVQEVIESIWHLDHMYPKYVKKGILKSIIVPDKIYQFRVSWVDDQGLNQVNNGYRV